MPVLTNIDVITRALRRINLNPEGVTPTAEQQADCLAELNSMLAKWEEDGIYLQWFAQTSASDDFPLPEYTQQGVIGHLAMRMAPVYSISLTPELVLYAEDGYQTISRKAMNRDLPRSDLSHLPRGASYGWGRITDG